jgi:hypothetical protein
MIVGPTEAWKLLLAVALGAAIFAAAYGAAPRRAVPAADLRRLVVSAIALYAVGAGASLTRHDTLAAVLYAAGISLCAFSLWLSRGRDAGEDPPPGGREPSDERPPPEPDGLPEFDFASFEREFRAYAERSREPAVR